MTFPAFAKTWQITQNTVVTAASSQTVQTQMMILAIKNMMKGFSSNPWVVQYSCNAGNNGGGAAASGAAGAAGDLVDRWSVGDQASGAGSTNDVNFAAAASRHSWIVLRQTGIQANFEVLFDCGVSSPTNQINLYVSPSAGFTGGSATARPTATDETAVLSAAGFFSSPATTERHILHGWQSTDGQCTRIVGYRGGPYNGVQDLFFMFDKVQSPVSGWTTPSVFFAANTAVANGTSFTNLGGTNVKARGNGGTPNFSCGFTEERWNNGSRIATTAGIGTSPNTFSGEWPVLPMGVASSTVGNAGRLGNIYDMWWRPSGVNNGDTFPNDVTARRLVAMGDIILPWSNDSTIPLMA